MFHVEHQRPQVHHGRDQKHCLRFGLARTHPAGGQVVLTEEEWKELFGLEVIRAVNRQQPAVRIDILLLELCPHLDLRLVECPARPLHHEPRSRPRITARRECDTQGHCREVRAAELWGTHNRHLEGLLCVARVDEKAHCRLAFIRLQVDEILVFVNDAESWHSVELLHDLILRQALTWRRVAATKAERKEPGDHRVMGHAVFPSQRR
mmetsp:Transcript_73658/g.163713  ORF Transcript_73658/g.163713 Transcript_73658/m.163713 type:complete len:208 (-) Transcript_73658:54-677(-)